MFSDIAQMKIVRRAYRVLDDSGEDALGANELVDKRVGASSDTLALAS